MKHIRGMLAAAILICASQAVSQRVCAQAVSQDFSAPQQQWDLSGMPGINNATQTPDYLSSAQQNAQEQAIEQQQQQQAAAQNGTPNRTSNSTGKQVVAAAVTMLTNPNLPPTYFGNIAGGGLPSTTLDSLVADAGGSAEAIYGDEGTDGPPPYFSFTPDHYIINGLPGGLTTNHQSNLPSAWGWPQ